MLSRLDQKLLPYLNQYREQNDVSKVIDKLTVFISFFELVRKNCLEDQSNLDSFIKDMKPNVFKLISELEEFKDIINEYEIKRKVKPQKGL